MTYHMSAPARAPSTLKRPLHGLGDDDVSKEREAEILDPKQRDQTRRDAATYPFIKNH